MTWLLFLSALLLGAQAADLDIRDHYSPLDRERPVQRHTRHIVLHTTEGGDASAEREVHRRGLANYLVLRSGRVLRIIRKDREARHAGTSMWNGVENLDRISIGIEVVGHHDRPITRRQERSIAELLRQLQGIYGIADQDVLAHSMVAYGHPNRWHRRPHRGRKRCGMQFGQPELRSRLGLDYAPAYDPDLEAGRLADADPELTAALYGRQIGAGQTPAGVVGDAFRLPSTVYVFPDGRRIRGHHIRDWGNIPAGTFVLLNQPGRG